MVGVSAKNKRSGSVQVEYVVHIEGIKPWPPSQSLRSLRSVLIQWENGERHSGSTNAVVPSIGSLVGEGRIEFNEAFRLPVTLLRDMPVKGKDQDTFQKNCLEFNLYEPRRDKAQLLATAVIDLAEYGVIKDTIGINAPVNSKRSFRNTPQPILHIKIQPVDKGRSSSSSRNSLSRVLSMDKNGGESVSALMNEEYAEEAEVASFADDDASSHSSLTNGSLTHRNEENGPESTADSKGGINREQAAASTLRTERRIASQENLKESSPRDLPSDPKSPANGHASLSYESNASLAQNVNPASSALTPQSKEEEAYSSMRSNGHADSVPVHGEVANNTINVMHDTHRDSKENTSSYNSPRVDENLGSTNSNDFQFVNENDGIAQTQTGGRNSVEESETVDEMNDCLTEDTRIKKQKEQEEQNLEEEIHSSDDESADMLPEEATRDEGSLRSDIYSLSEGTGLNGNILKGDRLKHVKSVRSSLESVRSNGLVNRNHNNEVKEIIALGDAQNRTGGLRIEERKNTKIYPKDAKTTILDRKIHHLEQRIKMLEGELREAAAIEAALYSVVAEHGSSMSKVHAPARRLSRLYIHACRESSQSRRACAARSAISGLVLVAKGCGNDVPRLTFWLSNCVMLRAIISQAMEDPELQLYAAPQKERNGGINGNKMTPASLKWKQSPSRMENKNVSKSDSGDWEDPHTFISALERVEAWIFSRTVESIWWQTLTPHMQTSATEEIDRFVGSGSSKNLRRTLSSGDQDQVNFSLDLWKNAFKDACERLCPVRAGGHECGCLPMLTRLVMEQCVARLDVAMFNAILRESDDEIPTDPVSDPISDSKVLPIPAGKSSFGAGAQLKNAIGNWSRWLTDLFGMDDGDDDIPEDEYDADDHDERQDTSFKSFHLLKSLSDLMMLPKDMLLSKSIRKEVCPTFGTSLIKRVLDNFVSDEFCPEPIPKVVSEALEDAEDVLEAGEESVTTVPCVAAPPIYLPPSSASIAGTIGELGNQSKLTRSGSSLLRKSHTSDDELDELNSPLTSILLDRLPFSPAPTKSNWRSKEKLNQHAIRYDLLRDIWMSSD